MRDVERGGSPPHHGKHTGPFKQSFVMGVCTGFIIAIMFTTLFSLGATCNCHCQPASAEIADKMAYINSQKHVPTPAVHAPRARAVPTKAEAALPPPPKHPRRPHEVICLVTGITGMIGSHVARALVARNYTVYGLTRFRSSLRNLGPLTKSPGIINAPNLRLVNGDITDPFRMEQLMLEIQPHYVYHFAAQAINGVSFDSAYLSLYVNTMGTFNLLEALRRVDPQRAWGTKLLIAGSSTEYGKMAETWQGSASFPCVNMDGEDVCPLPEEAPFDPVSPYGVSKVATEMLARMYHNTYGMHAITARFFIQVSSGGTEHLALQEFSRQIAMVENGLQEPVLLHGNLNSMRDMTDIRDSAPQVVQLCEQGLPGQAYNVATGTAYSIRQLLDTALSLSEVNITTQLDPGRLRAFDEKTMVASIDKIQQAIGWKPNVNMKDTVEDILMYWRREVRMRHGIE